MKISNKEPVVIFDIDFTIFNTATFRRNLYELLANQLGFSDIRQFTKLAHHVEEEAKEQVGYFKPHVFLTILQKKAKKEVTLAELEKTFFDESLYIESLYEDARDVFQELVMRRNIDIIIFSTGEKEFQMHKIKVLKNMLQEDRIHIFSDKLLRLKDVLLKYHDKHIFLVDDLPTILYEAKKLYPGITTVWVDNDKKIIEKDFFDKQETVEGFHADKLIHSLGELIPIISEY